MSSISHSGSSLLYFKIWFLCHSPSELQKQSLAPPFSLWQHPAMGSNSPLASAPVPAFPTHSVAPTPHKSTLGRDDMKEKSGPLKEMALWALTEMWSVFLSHQNGFTISHYISFTWYCLSPINKPLQEPVTTKENALHLAKKIGSQPISLPLYSV